MVFAQLLHKLGTDQGRSPTNVGSDEMPDLESPPKAANPD
jgi:hypothetical protein